MIPNVDEGLRAIAKRLLTRLVPDAKTTYAGADGARAAALLFAVADEMAVGIERRMQDIRAMRELLADGQAFHACEIPSMPEDLALATVNACHDALTRNLIALHTAVESHADPDARLLDARIWAYLGEWVARHQIRELA